jgi:signal transduction histidine kinase
MNPDWSEMRQMDGKNFLENLNRPRTSWMEAYVLEEDQPKVAAGIKEAVRTGGRFEMEHRVLRTDGKIGWIRSRAVPILNERAEIVEWFGAANDVTERKEGEQKFIDLGHVLEYRVGELQEQAIKLRNLTEEICSIEQRERKRVATLLHDDLQQLLVAARMQLGNATALMKDERARGAVEIASRWIEEATHAARDLTRQLRPPALHEEGLFAALHVLAAEMSERHHLRVKIHGRETATPLSDGLNILLFDSIRELLFNVTKHAEVDEVSVRVQEDARCIVVMVEDYGKGFKVEETASINASRGVGLFSLRDRLSDYGGSVSIVSSLGAGTQVTLQCPLQSQAR